MSGTLRRFRSDGIYACRRYRLRSRIRPLEEECGVNDHLGWRQGKLRLESCIRLREGTSWEIRVNVDRDKEYRVGKKVIVT